MSPETHTQLANFVWSICNLLRGPYKRNEYRKVILPLKILRRFDCLLAPIKAKVIERHAAIKGKPEKVVHSLLTKVSGRPFYNLSKLELSKDSKHSLLGDSTQLALNLNGYIKAFSSNVREIIERFAFDGSTMILLHAFAKKSRRTPAPDLDLARRRKKELEED